MHCKRIFIMLAVLFIFGCSQLVVRAQEDYTGSKTCANCHDHEYTNFSKYSAKANSWEHISKMEPKLTKKEFKDCLQCHTTGYAKGGFVSYEKTPELSNVGCETCHGPGLEHVQSGGDPSLIKSNIGQKDCRRCHNDARVEDFDFKPLIYGGVH